VPVTLSLVGTGVTPATCFFLGWFGPRGIASILYGLLLLGAASFPGRDVIIATMTLTVLLSIILHGVTAVPFSAAYARAMSGMADADDRMAEMEPVAEMPLRLGRTD